MKRSVFGRAGALLLSVLLILSCLSSAFAAEETITFLFTHDLHARFLPTAEADGGERGGYARLSSLLQKKRDEYAGTPVFTLDAGDFSMGSLFHTVYAEEALELRCLGALGYDAVTFGNHEYDFRKSGLTQMLSAAVSSGDPLPQIVAANYWPASSATQEDADYLAAAEKAGVAEYAVIEREGVRVAVFGLMGYSAHSNAPLSGMAHEPPADAAKRIVADIRQNANADLIVCLSHSGTDSSDLTGKSSEDAELARAVPEIDVIISGHTHSTLDKPLEIGGTLIVSCGEYGRNLGVLRVKPGESGKPELVEYELIPVDETVQEDPALSELIASFKDSVSQTYLSRYEGMKGYDVVLAETAFPLDTLSGAQGDRALGNLISDAYRWAMDRFAGVDTAGEPYAPVDAALIAKGVVRDTFREGPITVSDAFNVLSLGMGADGTAGYPLVSAYLTGKELKTVLEIDASISPLMSEARLFGSGVAWEINRCRMLLNRVADCRLVLADGTYAEIEDDKLYHCVTGQYAAQMLGGVTDLSKGILSVTLRDKNGVPLVTDGTYDEYVVHMENGGELKEWYALAAYLSHFEDTDGDSVPDLPPRYAAPSGAKRVYTSLSPVELFKNANLFTWLALAVILLLLTVLALVAARIVRRIRSKRRS